MTSEVFQPLIAVADSYIGEASPKISPETLRILKRVMRSFINGDMTFEDASNEFNNAISTTRPIDRIHAILNVTSTPISSTDSNNSQMQMIGGPRKKTHPWSEYEDQRLLAAIHKYGLDNWAPVSVFVGNRRTRAQCSQRWFRGLDPRISKVLWTAEEEKKLLQLIERYGDRAWTKISTELGNRSDAQCRYHYRQMMKESEIPNSGLSNSAIGGLNSSLSNQHDILNEKKQISTVMSAPSRTLRAEIGTLLPTQSLLISPSPSTITRPSLPPISSILSAIDSAPSSAFPPLTSPMFTKSASGGMMGDSTINMNNISNSINNGGFGTEPKQ
ncbi:Myb-like DNA-binding domain containing protein [Tritrichomonas foetus]|uniref:Myb-like DNA-binding domain containing protein n=1 Tax=Tritrichomonas foetus TaxID=1144522 RepID=A0A1J4JB13_9EUKA|nr:Myb-like DNA-binding domain containing protein [Tritrichomonas foetus]|eukprot:OHS96344.1 Myb-like DNA-binding domain containing protein [Tritrichomonas foetus]